MGIDGKILSISKSVPGSMHDSKLYSSSKKCPMQKPLIADSGYQGLQKLRKRVLIPIKKKRLRPLSEKEKAYNNRLSRLRVRIEHLFSRLKSFQILKQTYRNKGKRYNLKFNIIAGIVNLNHGF